MSKNNQKKWKDMTTPEKIGAVIGIILVVLVFLTIVSFLIGFIGGIFGSIGTKKPTENTQANGDTSSQVVKHDESQKNDELGSNESKPVAIGSDVLSMTGKEFANKYSGKWISFDGLIQGTAQVKGAPKPHTGLLIGDDINKGGFSDLSFFWISSSTMTFSDNLSEFAKVNSSPYETGNYPKVHVVAKVGDFNEDYSYISLDPIVNVDGKTPSVTPR